MIPFLLGMFRKIGMKKQSLSKSDLAAILHTIYMTRDKELTCEECFEQLDAYVSQQLTGKSTEDAFQLVKHHLETCRECNTEYELLLQALKAHKNE